MRSLFDNLVPLRRALDPDQYADWSPTRFERQGLGCHLLADERVPVDGDVSLSTDVYLPKAPGRYPAVVVFGAYNKELHTAGAPTGTNEIGSPPVFTDRGYAMVVGSRRGMGRSGGDAGVFFGEQDVDDHERIVAWAATQPWCDGRVVLFGTSYYAMTQLQLAVRRPAALKAFFAYEVCTDFVRQIVRFGGTFNSHFLAGWLAGNFNDTTRRLTVRPVVRAVLSWLTAALRPLIRAVMRRKMVALFDRFASQVAPSRDIRARYASWMLDGQTRASLAFPEGPAASLGQINVPFVVVHNLGCFNLHQFGSYDLFERAGTLRDQRWMILAPPHYELPVYSWQLEALAFFDHILHSTDNGYAAQARVRYWVEGSESYASADDFPIPGSRAMRLHLSSAGARAEKHTLRSEPPAGGQDTWAAVPPGAWRTKGFDEVANETLVYELPIERVTRLAGPLALRMVFSCTEIDSHVVARLGRVGSDGSYRLLSLGAMSPARRRIDDARTNLTEIAHQIGEVEPLVPGARVQLAFSLPPAPTELQPGDVLRLEIGSRTDLLRSDLNHGFVHFDLPVPPYFARNTVHYGAGTYLEVHEIG